MKRIANEDLHQILTYTRHLWEPVRNKNIFITGGTGFFGKWLLESFVYINRQLQLNAQATVLTRNAEAFLKEFPFYREEVCVEFINGDILSFTYPDKKFDYLIHAATEADAALNQQQPLLMLDTITAGTRRVLDFALKNPVRSFLFTSSGAVYGRQPAQVTHVKETDSFPVDINNPASAYAEGKRVAELYCSTYFSHYQLPVKIARCFAFVGPYLPLNKHFAIGNFINDALHQQDIIIKGDGTPYRSYLYAADLTIWLWTILFKGENNVPYNVGSDEDYSLKDVAQKVQETQPGIKVTIYGTPDPAKPVERYVPCIERIKAQLGVAVITRLEEAIKKTNSFNQ